jgi:hypothetical protein
MNLQKLPFLSISLILIFLFSVSKLKSQQIVFVKPNGTGNGSSWAQATGNLKLVLESATSGTEIWVAQGTYKPVSCSTCTPANRSEHFVLNDGVTLLGGFQGTEIQATARMPFVFTTILSGDIDSDNTAANNSINIIYARNTSSQTRLDGFTIKSGNATEPLPLSEIGASGAGLFLDSKLMGFNALVVSQCIFTQNNALGFGAAVCINAGFNGNCTAEFKNCQFSNNFSSMEGGAVGIVGYFGGQANPKFSFCDFTGNRAQAAGGAVFTTAIQGTSLAEYKNCRFIRNHTDTYGGAIYNLGKSGNCSPKIEGCLFWANNAFSAAGTYFLGSQGGNSSPTITNCVYYKNTANTGAAIYANASDSTGNSVPIVKNCIIWQNYSNIGRHFRVVYGRPEVSHCLVDTTNCAALTSGFGTGVNCGSGMLYDQDPLFNNPESGDFHLRPGSPAIDAGFTAATQNLPFDLDSLPRLFGSSVDLGIYEFNPAVQYPPQIVAQPQNKRVCAGSNLVVRARVSGSPPLIYKWFKNDIEIVGENADSLKFTNASPAQNGSYRLEVRNNLGRIAATNNAVVVVEPVKQLEINLSELLQPRCEGDSLVLNATVSGNPLRDSMRFSWRINGAPVLESQNPVWRLINTSLWFRYSVKMTTTELCAFPKELISSELQTQAQAYDTLKLVLRQTNTGICEGDVQKFNADVTNGGAALQYQWTVNNTAISNALASFESTSLRNADRIRVRVTSSRNCLVNGNTLQSSEIALNLRTRTPVGLSLSAQLTELCVGDTFKFTARSTGGGLNPQYQWWKNNLRVGNNSPNYSFMANNSGEKVWVEMRSSETCPALTSLNSDSISVVVNQQVVPTIVLTPSKSRFCRNDTLSFRTSGNYFGLNPSFEWLLNGRTLNFTQAIYRTDSFRSGDLLRVRLTSSERCAVPNSALSNAPNLIYDCTATRDLAEPKISLYPNPSTVKILNFELDEPVNLRSVAIFDAQGRQVFSKKMDFIIQDKKQSCDVSNLENGYFLVRFDFQDHIVWKKWVIIN